MRKYDFEAQKPVQGYYGSPENFIDDKEIRRKFINKVYLILTSQVLYTILFVSIFMNVLVEFENVLCFFN